MDKENLKPCPFCGGEATIKCVSFHSSRDGWGDNYKIECISCGIVSQEFVTEVRREKNGEIVMNDGRKKAIEFWNRRVNEDER